MGTKTTVLSVITNMRKRRELKSKATYHVTARINRRELLLSKKEEKRHLLITIEKARKRYSFVLEGFCVMGNHLHLVIKPTNGANLSRIMQWIMSVYAMSWNKRHGQTGHVWGGRFFSRILQGFRELINVIEYVDNNPLRAGLVNRIADWEASGLFHRVFGYKGLVGPPPDWLKLVLPRYSPLMLSN